VSDLANGGFEEPRVSIEMGGPNIVIRSCADIDRGYTTSLALAVNAAADTRTVVVLDPAPIRCDDAFSGALLPDIDVECAEHASCRPVDVEVVGRSVIRIAAHRSWWTIDVAEGRFCQTDTPVDPSFVSSESWTPVVAVCVTPTRLRALRPDGELVSALRAHRPLSPTT
jgi:hypothetical protein